MTTEVQQNNNVLDFKTGKPILPDMVRRTLIGQYLESKHLNHNPEQFVSQFERRLFAELAYSGAQAIRNIVNDMGRE